MIIDIATLRVSCEQRNIPLISRATEQFLTQWCHEHRPIIVAEIGAAVGYSTCMLQILVGQRGGQVISVESSFPHYKEAVQNVSSIAQSTSTIYYGSALNLPWKTIIYQPIDLLFVDARKSEYGEYVRLFESMMAPDGVIICDDVIKFKHKMHSLYSYLDQMQIKFEIHQLDQDDGIMVMSRK